MLQTIKPDERGRVSILPFLKMIQWKYGQAVKVDIIEPVVLLPVQEIDRRVWHYKYTCKKTGKTAFAPYYSTGFPGNFVECDVTIEDRTKLEEPCKSCNLEIDREDVGFR